MDEPLENRLLRWSQLELTPVSKAPDPTTPKPAAESLLYVAQSEHAVAFVKPKPRSKKFEWFIFVHGLLSRRGKASTLHAALSHVEGNFVGRHLLDGEAALERSDLAAE